MHSTPIRTEADYKRTLKRIEQLMDADANTPEGDELDVLVTLVEAYERVHYPMDMPDPIEAIKFTAQESTSTKPLWRRA